MTTFSFVIPVYNVEALVARCIESILGQDYDRKCIQVILVDDGSTDASGQICDKFSEENENVLSLHKANGGLSDARNYGLRHATNDYIVFVDSDDYVSTSACTSFDEIIKRNGFCDVITGGVCKEIGNKKIKRNNKELPEGVISGKDFLIDRLSKGIWDVAAWSSIYKRAFLVDNKLLFKTGIFHEDEEFSPRVFLKASNVACNESIFYHYVIRENSITTAKDKRIKTALDIFYVCENLDLIYRTIDDNTLKKLLYTHNAKICLRAVETGELYLKENRHLMNKALIRRNAIFIKEKCRALILTLCPSVFHLLMNGRL